MAFSRERGGAVADAALRYFCAVRSQIVKLPSWKQFQALKISWRQDYYCKSDACKKQAPALDRWRQNMQVTSGTYAVLAPSLLSCPPNWSSIFRVSFENLKINSSLRDGWECDDFSLSNVLSWTCHSQLKKTQDQDKFKHAQIKTCARDWRDFVQAADQRQILNMLF